MGYANYLKKPYKTPEDLKDKHIGSSVLIIGSGTSTGNLLKYKEKLRDYFDVIIGVNLTCIDFSDTMDYHMIMERYADKMVEKMCASTEYRNDLTRVLNFKNIRYFPKDIPIIKARRDYFDGEPDITKYCYRETEGLLDDQRAAEHKAGIANYGTVIMQALHFSCIIGGKDIYLAGADLMFKDEYDHYYKDKSYRSPKKHTIQNRPVIINSDGKDVSTTHAFYQSAKWLDKIIKDCCLPIGIKVYDFSDGLITKAESVNIDNFFGGK